MFKKNVTLKSVKKIYIKLANKKKSIYETIVS